MMILGLGDKCHVGLIQVQGIDQRQGFIVKTVDIASETAAFLTHSGAQREPTRQAQNGNSTRDSGG